MRCFSLIVLFLLTACASHPELGFAPEAISVTARRIALDPADPARDRVGKLRWMGGVSLTSPDRRLGGLSSLRWHDGVLMSASDDGNFFAFRPRERDDRLIGVEAMRVRRLMGLDGRPLQGKDANDFESLEVSGDPGCTTAHCPITQATLSLESDSAVWTYRMEQGLPVGPPIAMTAGAAWRARQAHTNGGIEAMAGSASIWLMVSEELRDAAGQASAYLMHNGLAGDDGPPRCGEEIGIPVTEGFKPTDLVLLPSAPPSFLMLQRYYREGDMVAMRLGRFALLAGADPAHVRVGPIETLATLRPPLTVDNMEGLAVRREGGRTFVYIVSDDNFSPTQRILLMKWELLD